MVSPAPPNKLTELLEDQQVKYSTCSHLIIIVSWYTVPVKPLERL